MKKRLMRYLAILVLASILVLATLMIVPALGDQDQSDIIEALEDLRGDISVLPGGAEGFKNPRAAEGQRNALSNKIDAVIHQIESGASKGAVNKLRNDLINAIEGWVNDQWVDELVEKVERIIDLILGIVPPVHDIAVTAVDASPTEVNTGELVYINVTVANEGTKPEAFDVYVYADTETTVVGDEITIGIMLNVTLDPEANKTLSFAWNTTDTGEGTYTISAKVPSVEGEEKMDNNFFVDGTVIVSPLLPQKHDVAVTSVAGPDEVTQGTEVPVIVGVANPGDFQETFNISVTYDTTIIETGPVPLNSKDSKFIIFLWDTDGVTPGTYNVTAEAVLDTDENLTNNKASTSITINPRPATPAANFTFSPATPYTGETITFNATESYDPDGYIIWYYWSFGDNTYLNETDPITNHAYADDGTYTAMLLVSDNEESTSTVSASVTVLNRPPVASFAENATTVFTGDVIRFDASGSNDPDGSIVSYFWDFGDGTDATGVTVNHVYEDDDTYTVTLTVTDNDGATASATAVKTVSNRPPVASFTESAESVITGETITFDASQSYDLDGDIINYFWDFGDDTTRTGMIVNHTYTEPGNYTVTLTVTDNDGATSSMSREKTVETPAGWPLALLAAIGLGIAALTATLLYALYRKRKKKETQSSSPGSPPAFTLYVPAWMLASYD